MSFVEPHFKKLLWYLQCEEKADRNAAFAIVQRELNSAIKALPFDYLKMMQLLKGLYLYLYKEDDIALQRSIAEGVAELIHACPNQREMEEIFCVEEAFEPEEDEGEDDEIVQNKDYGGPKTLFFRCLLETLIREWNSVDYLRQSKFMYLARQAILQMMISGFSDQGNQHFKYIQTLELVIFSPPRIKNLAVQRSLVLHVIDVWNDSLHAAVKAQKPSKDNFALSISVFGQFLATLEEEAEIQNSILINVFDDFTEISFYQDENFGNYLGQEAPTLQDAFWILGAESAKFREDFENFAQEIEEFVAFWASPESEKYRKLTKTQGLKMREKAHLENLEIVNCEAVRLAKMHQGDAWERYVDKENEEWEYDAKLPVKAMRQESIYVKGYQRKADDL
ncbi:Nucleolar protein NOP52 [Spironucleus salmonicida]|uniref:Nucleolar protein NOP52 n=1 Tax=Spironucleus salmonicida TaxID=348837 RepID=V6LWH5_9EUKA|nr:Nucleolar protein NOP52 [Spironucleus salmonicida]|eukprot:EST48987.1 Nucleolar protein NOP52 [Spironucleus salmonicida]